MNTFDGYIRRDGTNSKVLLDGGDAKALSSFIGTISYTNNKITYTKADGTSYDLVDLSNYIYNLRAATSDNLGGIRIGFSQSGKNYPVQLDSNNKAYVYVPWEENSHYTTRLYVGDGTAENKVTTNGNTRITVTDNNNVRNYITLIGSGATNISSDDNGKITINSTNTTYNTGDSATLNKGTNTEGKLWSAKTLVDYISDILGVDSTAITSLNTLIGQLHDNDTATGILVELAKKLNTPSSSIGSNNQPIYWNGSSFTTIGYTIEKSVPSNAIFTDTKYSFYVGENNNIKEHKNVSNPYFKLFENNNPTFIQIKAGTGISVSSDINGNITIKNESPDQNHNTWRPIKIEGTEKLGSATNTDALNLTAGNGIEVSYDSTNKKVIIKNTKPDQNHDTHYTTSMYIGENNDTKANKAVNSPYFKLFDNDTRRSTLRFVAGSGIGIASDDSGNITITNSSPDQNHNTDKTGIKLGTISGTKKTDSTVIINNSSTGLTIAGGTNKFSIGDGTNYIEIPITPSFTVNNKDSTIGTSLTTIATIAGTDIKAKIDSYLPLSGGTMTGVINWGAGQTREILQFTTQSPWRSGLRYSWSNYTTVSLWGEHKSTAFVWTAGNYGEINGHSNNTYDFRIRRESGVVVARIAGNTVYHSGNLPAYPTKESWNYDDRYLKLSTGGTVLGTTTFKTDSYGTQLEIYINTNNGNPSIKFNNPNSIINRYIGFETSRNGDNAFYFTDNNATNKYYVASEEYVTSRGYISRYGHSIGYRHIDAGPYSSWSDSSLYIGYGISPNVPTKLIKFYYSEVINNEILRKEVAQIGTDGLSLLNNRIWIKSASETGGTTNRLELTSGLPSGYGQNKKGTLIYSNGIAFLDPYNTGNNDGAWIRHIETTGNQGTLEIAVGNDAINEEIHFRWYNTSNQISKDIVIPRNSGTIALTSDLSNYLTINTNQIVSGVKTFNNGCWNIAGSENNEITTEHFANSKYYNNANTACIDINWSITNALKFRWYSDYWLIGNIRSGNTNTAGFGIALRDNTNNRQIDCFRVTKEGSYIKGYVALHTGNSSVSKSGQTLTVNIGGTSYSLTNNWRGITDSYSGTNSTISLSQKGGNDLYNSLLNGYASSAGYAEYSHKLDIYGYSSNGLSFYQTSASFDDSSEGWAHYIIANHGNGESYYHYTIRLPFFSIPQYRRQTGSMSNVSQWYNFITEENISSQSVNYATYANYLNLISSNEIRFNKIPSSSTNIHFNYLWAEGIADDKIIDYRFMNGNRGYAGIIAEQLSCTNGYIYLYGPGSGTYNLSNIFSDSSGLTIETPRATDAQNGTVLPLMVKTRGGQWSKLQTGTIVANGNVTATAFYASSDFRLKNILTHPNYSAKQLASLPLVKYTWKDKENDSIHLGSIAQDVERIIPEVVNIDNKGYKSLDYATLGAIGVISLAREIVKLKKEIKELKSKLYGN